jgi:DNA-binding NtrC family response regulator
MRHRVLVIDDDPVLLRALTRELQRTFDVVAVEDGEAGLLVMRGPETPAAVVSDYQLGASMDGLAVLRAVRELSPSCVRVLVSGSVAPEVAIAAKQEGLIHAVFVKPWEPGAVQAVLERALSGEQDDGPAFVEGLEPGDG